jgi:UDP-N-acetylmuramate--alanine ligase
MDDYGHHPTAINSTLKGVKEFYPRRRLMVSFMSHTYTRTAALLEDFAVSLLPADIVFLHKIYPSAREVYSGGVNGITLYEKTKAVFEKEKTSSAGVEPSLTSLLRSVTRSAGEAENQAAGTNVFYVEEPEDAAEQLKSILQKGDLFITMGAGDNWRLGKKIFDELEILQKPVTPSGVEEAAL